MSRFLIWGAGGHGKVVADLIRATGHDLVGYVDIDSAKLNQVVEPGGGRVVVLQDDLIQASSARQHLFGGAEAIVPAVGHNRIRLRCLDTLHAILAPPLVHPSAVVSPSATLGPGSVVFPGAIINADARIGRAVIVNTGAIIEHDCRIGDGAHLSPRATLAGTAQVGACAWVGAGAVLIQGVSVGEDSVVGAGAVVIRNVADGETVAGVPARPIRPRSRT